MGVRETRRGPSGRTLPGRGWDPCAVEARLRGLFPGSQVILAYLFGSCARGEAGPGADVDIAVLLAGGEGELYEPYRELLLRIRDALGRELFDLLLLNDASPTMRFIVVTSGRLLYARSEEELNAFEGEVIRRYQDTAHLRAVQNEYLRRRARAWYSEKRA